MLSSSQVGDVMSMIHVCHRLQKQLVPSFLLTGKEDIPLDMDPSIAVCVAIISRAEWEVLG